MCTGKIPAIMILLSFSILSASVQAKYSGGSGTAGAPYQIANAADLLALAANTGDYGKHFVLTVDINLSSYSFTTAVVAPQGGTTFLGVFDGAGHEIVNLTINTNGAGNDYLGLFGFLDGGEVKNLGLKNVTITDGNYSHYLGGLVGINYPGSNISNCYSKGTVSGGGEVHFLGGLVGGNYGTVSNCYSTGAVTTGGSSLDLGGLVGWSDGSISSCYSTVAVTGGDSTGNLGGLVGYNDDGGNISNCYATGVVAGGGNLNYLGGLVGVNGAGSSISNCCSAGDVNGGSYSGRLGGLVGGNYGTTGNSYSTGKVTGGDRAFYLGGLAGYNGGSINNCYLTGNVIGGDYSFSLGGLVGYDEGDNVDDCYSTGVVTGGYKSYWLGGLIGMSYSTIKNCYFLINSGPNNGYGTPLTDTQMKHRASFVGWDFVGETANGTDDIWAIREDIYYPKLVWKRVNLIGWYKVDFVDFAAMANWWGRTDCAISNDCNGADLDFSGTVDIADLEIFCNYWLEGL